MRPTSLLAGAAALIGVALAATPPSAAAAIAPRGDAPPAKLFVRAARVWTGAPAGGKVAPFLSPGALLIVDGKVVDVAATLEPPADATVVDLGDATLMPGLVDASTTLAGTSDWINAVWKDEAVAPQFDPADGFDALADWRTTLLGGVTTVYLGCGDARLVSGQGAVAKLATRDGKATLLARKSALEVNLTGSALNARPYVDPPLPPSADNPIKPAQPQLPTNRIGQLMGVREAFAQARAADASATPAMAALADAVQSRRTLRLRANEASELVRATQLARELGHPALIAGGAEASLVADQLAGARYPVIVELGVSLDRPPTERAPDVDAPRLRPESAAELVRRGVKVALATPPGSNPADLLMAGALALRGGLTTEQAVAAVTRVPAELLGVGHRVGCLMPGKDADFVVLSGEPFLRSSHVQKVYVEGRLAAELPAAAANGSAAIVLRAGTVLTASGDAIRNGAVSLKDGRILAVGSDVAVPPGARIVDCGPAAVITPGFLDANSHLEFGDDRTNLSLDYDLTMMIAGAGDEALEVARHGVTTALIQPWQAYQGGSRVTAVKTAGATRAVRLVDDVAAVKLYWRGPFDPIATADRYRAQLGEAKRYADAWTKYADDLKKWEEEQRKKKAEAAASAAAEKPKAEAKPAGDVEEPAKEKKADPITGRWELTLKSDRRPEPMKGSMSLKLDGERVTGSMAALFGSEDEPASMAGTFSGKHLVMTIDVEIPIGKPMIEADLDGDDKLAGKLKIGERFSFELSAERTDKSADVVTVAKKKKGSPDGRPTPPDARPDLDPFRRVLAGQSPILLECDSAIGIHHALKVFADAKVEVVLMGADELWRLPLAEWKGVVKGIVVPEQIEVARTLVEGGATVRRSVVPAAELSGLGVPVAFQSNGVTAARGLALNAAFAVREGMDPRAALRALTIDPARLFHVDDQVGSLEPGKQGDVLVFSGDPFELSSKLLHVFVGGEEIALEMKP